MQRISITNPQNVIDGTAKKYYFKLRNTGGPKGDKGDKGDTGATGPQGPQGNAATVSVGSTTTLPVGYDATVTNTGSIYNAVLNFGIPQGPQGPQGAKGDKGDTGAQGETGPRGPQGERGTNATVYVGTTTTTNPGTQARVYNSGTDSNAVLNFEIPRGDVGPQPELVQTTGTSTTKAMSQNATTNALATKQNTIDSSHKLSADLVTDTSTTNKFVTASEKATWNAKQNALTAGDNITISGDTISTPAIVPEVVAELPTTGSEGKLYLTPKNYTRSTATGNPITATITEEAGSLESFQLDGDTFQQSYTGKNLANVSAFELGNISNTGAISDDRYFHSPLISVVAGSSYTASAIFPDGAGDKYIRIAFYASDESFISRPSLVTPHTATAPSNAAFCRISLAKTATDIMLELGSAATSYEPYVGGTPSPNPDYPQAVQTVTGTQTISINGTDYPLDLGDIELCEIEGHGQPLVFDRIYSDGENWKIRKTIAKQTIVGSEVGLNSSYTNVQYATVPKPSDSRMVGNYTAIFILNDHALYRYNSSSWNNSDLDNGVFTTPNQQRYWFGYPKGTSLETMQQELDGAITYYALATATDTTITDTALIAQLEAIRTASLENGTNTITNTAAGSNLAGDMEIGYYGYNPTNRYDKFIWLDLNNNYEQIGE